MEANKDVKNIFRTCPLEFALNVIGNKWKGAILYHLMHETKRFNELRRLLPTVTQRMLTLQLRELEKNAVIVRHVYAEVPPKVEYSLTQSGKKLIPILLSLREWGQECLHYSA